MAALQDTTDLISELASKLAELDGKVAAYRLDMVAEFQSHSEDVLRSVPGDVAYRVSQAISESLTNFPSLYPPGSLSSSHPPASAGPEETPHCVRGSPPPILPHTSGNPRDAATLPTQTRGPHDRELEFQGLFTPTFLPLLENADRPLHLAPTSSIAAPASPGPAPALSGSASASSDSATPEAVTVGRQLSPTHASASEVSPIHRRPSPLRRATNTSIDSNVSDSGSAKLRKSALRRSSGSSRPPDSPRDPRRVRFDFQGQEVLPSSSPQTSFTAAPETDNAATLSAPPVESQYITSLGDIEGEEDHSQSDCPPRKVSSSQALRALSKAPLDEGTIWTIVNTEGASETSSSSDTDKVRKNTAINASSHFDTQERSMDSNNTFGLPKAEVRSQTRDKHEDDAPGTPRTSKGKVEFEEEEDSDDEANALFMMSRKGGQKTPLPVSSKAASRKTVTSPIQHETIAASPIPVQARFNNPATASAASPMPIQAGSYHSGNSGQVTTTSAPSVPVQADVPKQTTATALATGDVAIPSNAEVQNKYQSKKENHKPATTHADNDDEAVFDFDDDDESVKPKHAGLGSESFKKYLSETSSSEDDSESDDTVSEPPVEETKAATDDVPCSPPIQTADRRPVTPEHKVPNKVPRKPAGSRPLSTSIGTYDGKPVTPHVVKNKALRDQLKNQESDVPFFVGSVNGNSGVDASNVKSYQASVMSPTTASGAFASGSFAERLMWERSQGVTYDSEGEGRKADKGGENEGKGLKKGGGG
ncbi:unnamed protein product [Discula destructiva]